MEQQIQQMKHSIANIQHHLRKLQHEETVKIPQQSILPDSIIHEHTYQKPTPTPKITSSIPNITHTNVYTPRRHHLDDTQMRNALKYQECKASKTKPKGSKGKRNFSLTAKTKYIYDGARVVYIPPLVKSYSDYGHILIQNQKGKNRKGRYQAEGEQDQNLNVQTEYGTVRVVATERPHQSNKKKQKNKRNKQFRNQQPAYNDLQQSVNSQRNQDEKNTRQTYLSSQIQMKSIKIQCNRDRRRVKQPFKNKWNPNTDSQFSDFQF